MAATPVTVRIRTYIHNILAEVDFLGCGNTIQEQSRKVLPERKN